MDIICGNREQKPLCCLGAVIRINGLIKEQHWAQEFVLAIVELEHIRHEQRIKFIVAFNDNANLIVWVMLSWVTLKSSHILGELL